MVLFLLASRFQLCPMHETCCLLFKHHRRSKQPWKSYMFGNVHVICLHDCGKSMPNISLFSYAMFSYTHARAHTHTVFVLNICCSSFFIFNMATVLRYRLGLFTALLQLNFDFAQDAENKLESRKYELLNIIQDTQRGLVTTADQRSTIEEAMVVVEGFDAGKEIDLSKLDGTWRLQYTSAPDVLILFESAARLPLFQVGQIFQKFECQNESRGGLVRNVIKWSVPRLLEENEGATLIVSARFSCVSARNIYLKFEEISLQNINISDDLQAVIAPAILPRSFLSLQILQFIRTFKAQVPVTSPERRSVGGLYYLSYLDKNMLLGRAVGGGGVFIFTRAQALIC